MFKKRWIGAGLLLAFIFVIVGCARAPQETIPEAPSEPVKEIPIVAQEVMVAIEPGSTLAIRSSPGTNDKPEDDVLDRVPGGRILELKNKHENTALKDGHIWWEVLDPSTRIEGWAAAKFLEEK
jgi:hypothetical protein